MSSLLWKNVGQDCIFCFSVHWRITNTYNNTGNIVGTQKKKKLVEGIVSRGWTRQVEFLAECGLKKVYSSGGLCCISRLIINNWCCQHLPDVLYETCYMALLKKRELPLHSHVRIFRKIMFYQVNYSSLTLESSVMHCSLLINNAKTIARKDKGQWFILHNLYVNLINCAQWYLGM